MDQPPPYGSARTVARHVRLAVLCGAWLVTGLMTGCTAQNSAATLRDHAPVPSRFTASTDAQQVAALPANRWCSDFGAPELDALIRRALHKNLDIKSAWARLRQARALQKQSGASAWPQVGADLSVTRRPVVLPPPVGITSLNQYGASLSAAYEVDLWGRLRAGRAAAKREVEATRADAETIAITIASQVAEAWFDVVWQRATLRLLDAQERSVQGAVSVLKARVATGRADLLAIQQQHDQQERITTQRIQAKLAEQLALQRLGALLSVAPAQAKTLVRHEGLPALPALPAPGLPAALLQRRPDVRAARARLAAADQRVVVAVASRLPALRLSASIAMQAFNPLELLGAIFWGVGGSLTQALVDGGARKAEVERAEATAEQLTYNYARAWLTALYEVEAALTRETSHRALHTQLTRQQTSAQRTLTLALSRYQSGASEYLQVVSAQRSLDQLQTRQLDLTRQHLSARVQLCRALGGTWTAKLRELPAPNSKGRAVDKKNKKNEKTRSRP